MAPGSAMLLADLIEARDPAISPAPYAISVEFGGMVPDAH
jgi:glycine/D-amino acid oxidase-like deaminating enzyme